MKPRISLASLRANVRAWGQYAAIRWMARNGVSLYMAHWALVGYPPETKG